jgi:hypothetical protein
MRKLFTGLFLCVLTCATFAQTQQVEFYVGGIDLSGGDTLKFGESKNVTIKLMRKKMHDKSAYCPINDTIVFDNVVLEKYKYDIVLCYFSNDKLYKIKFKTIITEDNIDKYGELKFNSDLLKLLIRDKSFIMEQIYQDTHIKNIK